jgi:hypothetical protein
MTRLKAWIKDFDEIKARKRGRKRDRKHLYESEVLAVRLQEVRRQRRDTKSKDGS